MSADPTRQHHHPDPATDAIVWHARRADSGCLCGWYVLGASWAEHLAGIVRPLVEAEVRERVAREIEADPCAEHGEVGCQAEPCWREGLMASHYARVARGSDG